MSGRFYGIREILHFVQDDNFFRVILSPTLSVMLSKAKHLSFPLRAGSAKNLNFS
jgi:hypothetical protein